MLRTVHLHGRLGKKFGKKHRFDVESPAEAIRALCEQIKGFKAYIADKEYALVRGENIAVSEHDLHLNFGKEQNFHILPKGSVAGIGTLLVIGIGLISAALSVVTLLSVPRAPDASDREEETRNDSFIFDGAQNVTEQGHPVPLIYGRMRVGSHVISSGLDTTDVNEAGVGVGSGFIGSTPGIGGSIAGNNWNINLLKGGKSGSGGGRAAQEDPNSLQSQATAKILDLLGEGEIVGLVDGLKSIHFDDTVLQNSDDTFNYAGVAVQERKGLPDQDSMPGFAQTENSISVDTEVNIDVGPVTRTIINDEANVARVTLSLPRLYQQDTENGDLRSTSVTVGIQLDSNGSGFTEVLRHTFTGKTNSPYQRSFDIRLPSGQAPHNIRVVRISPDSEIQSLQNETRFDFLTEIVEAKLIYPNSALIGLTVDARQFGSNIPTRSYDVKGLIIDVPSNYDPETRAYNGIWDGTFKRAWTDNPAWVWRDLIKNERYGLGRLVDANRIDKWTLYAIAQYCDEMVSDGLGGQEPRYTINVVIRRTQQAYELLASIASTFRGWAHWGSGSVMATQDRPEDPTLLVTESNAVGGDFDYDRVTPLDKRRSVVLVQWNDPEDSYRLATEVIEDPDLVRRFGWEPRQPIVAYGCTSRGQARRFGMFTLEDEGLSNAGVEYEAGEDHSFVQPGRIIEVSDTEFTQARLGGRVRSAAENQITLDSPVVLVQGQIYSFSVIMADGTLSRRGVTNGAGAHSTLSLSGPAWSDLPVAGAVWTLESNLIANRLWRVRTIETDEAPYKVRGILHDPTKFARVEQGLDLAIDNYLPLPSGGLVAPERIDIREYLLKDGNASTPAVQMSWTASNDPRVLYYQAQYQPPNDNWQAFEDSPSLSRELRNITSGLNSFRVRAVDALGRKTAWAVKDFTLTGQVENIPSPINFIAQVDNNALTTVLSWLKPIDSRPLRYEILFNQIDDFNAAVSLGFTTNFEFPVKEIGFYWVRSEFADEVSNNPVMVNITNAELPSPQWERVDNRPNNLADLDSVANNNVAVLLSDVTGLQQTYGDTASAAESALAASEHEDATLLHRNAALAAEQGTIAARNAAEDALDNATAKANESSASAGVAAGHAATSEANSNAALGAAQSATAQANLATSRANESLTNANASAVNAQAAQSSADMSGVFSTAASNSVLEASIFADRSQGQDYSKIITNDLRIPNNILHTDNDALADNQIIDLSTIVVENGVARYRHVYGQGNHALWLRYSLPAIEGHTYRLNIDVESQDPFRLFNHFYGWDGVSWVLINTNFGNFSGPYDEIFTRDYVADSSYEKITFFAQPFVQGAGRQVDLFGFWLEDVTAQVAAQNAANTSITNAAAAAVSETEAGVSATAAENSRIAAETANTNAQSAASITETNRVLSEVAAAAAQSSIELSASLATGHQNPNSKFSIYTNEIGQPDFWNNWTGSTSLKTRVNGRGTNPYAVRIVGEANGNGGIFKAGASAPSNIDMLVEGNWYVAEAEVEIEDGTLRGSGLYIEMRNTANQIVNSANRVPLTGNDVNGNQIGDGAVGGTYRYAYLFQAPAGVSYYNLFVANHWTGFNQNYNNAPVNAGDRSQENILIWHEVGVRSATQAEIEINTALPQLEATVAINQAALASIDGRTQAHWSLVVNAGSGAPAFIAARDTSTGNSNVGIGGHSVDLFTATGANTGEYISALTATGGNVNIHGNLTAGAGIALGTTGNLWPVALKPRSYTIADGTVVSFGVDLGSIPDINFSTIGLDVADTGVGEAYNLYADNLTSTGFTARLKISVPGTPTIITLSNDTAPSTGPTRQIAKGSNADSGSSSYEFRYSGNITVVNQFAFGNEYFPGTATVAVGIWVKKSGVWIKVANDNFSVKGLAGTQPTTPRSFLRQETFQLGSGISDFGITIESTTNASNQSLTDFIHVMWSAPGSQSGQRSATPNNQTTRAIVTP